MEYQDLNKFITKITADEIAGKAKDIERIYQATLNDIRSEMSTVYASFLNKVDGEDYYNELIKFNRLEKLEATIVKTYNSHYAGISANIKQSSKLAVSNTFYRSQYQVNWVKPYDFVVLNPKIAEFSVTRSADLLKEIINPENEHIINAITPKSGKTLKQILKSNRLTELARVLDTVNNGLLRGDSFQNMAKSLKNTFEGNLNNSLRVVRTEGHRNMETGRFLQWEEAKEAGIDGVREIISTLDNRTRKQSGTVDGLKDTGKGFRYPGGVTVFIPGNSGRAAWDINDRESVLELVDGVGPTVRRGRNPATGENEIIDYKAFDEWAGDNNLKKNIHGEIVPNKVKIKKPKPKAKKIPKAAPKPKPKAPEFGPPPKSGERIFSASKTTAEAEINAVKMGLGKIAEYKGIKPKAANAFNAAVFDVFDRYTFLNPVNVIGRKPQKGALASAHARILNIQRKFINGGPKAHNDLYEQNISVFTAHGNRIEKAKKRVKDFPNSAWAKEELEQALKAPRYKRYNTQSAGDPTTSIKNIIDHEMGHVIHDQLTGYKTGDLGRSGAFYTKDEGNAWDQILKTVFNRVEENGDFSKISQYSKKNHRELFAEAFAMYNDPKLIKELPEYMKKVIKDFTTGKIIEVTPAAIDKYIISLGIKHAI